VLAFIAAGVTNSAYAYPVVYSDPPSKATEAFQNVKELHLYVCNYRLGEGLPNVLKPQALAQEVLKYVKTWIDTDINVGLAIKFADGKKHEPVVTTDQPCEALYDPAMEEPGNLTLIVKVLPILVGEHPHDTPPALAILTGLLYRPDHMNSIAPILRAKPQLIWNLQADAETIKKEINWNMGWHDDYQTSQKPKEKQ
jgi:hypothetical protein